MTLISAKEKQRSAIAGVGTSGIFSRRDPVIITPSGINLAVSVSQREHHRSWLMPFREVGQYKNIIGQQVRKFRYQRGLKQRELAAKLELAGWTIDRAGVAKIEARLIKVSDYQQIVLARVLNVTLEELFPPIPPHERVGPTIEMLLSRKNR